VPGVCIAQSASQSITTKVGPNEEVGKHGGFPAVKGGYISEALLCLSGFSVYRPCAELL